MKLLLTAYKNKEVLKSTMFRMYGSWLLRHFWTDFSDTFLFYLDQSLVMFKYDVKGYFTKERIWLD